MVPGFNAIPGRVRPTQGLGRHPGPEMPHGPCRDTYTDPVMKPAFSTVACPDWIFSRLAQRAEQWGYVGAELRTFGYGSRELACEPALTSPAKLRGMLERAGVSICSLATGIRYDDPITPPIVGLYLDHEQMIRETKACVDLAVQLEAPFVRVFGFEIVGSEPRKSALARITDRLIKCADYCRNSGVRLVLENGGSFCTAVDLSEILDRVDSPMLAASYSLPVAQAAGESIENGVNVLGERLAIVKVKDLKNGKPVALGEGELNARAAIEAAAKGGFDGWLVYEYDRAWLGADGADVDGVLARSAKTMFEWLGRRASVTRRPAKV
jgi:sugar phosphate isomerase/epimerase